MNGKVSIGLIFGLCLLVAFAGTCEAKQLAVVVGNNTYAEVPQLEAAVSDARAMSEGLKHAGFVVELVENGTKRQMSRAFASVEGKIEPGDTVLFHFSGHGFEIDGQNWLLPIDVPKAQAGEEGLVKDESFNAADVVERFRARGAGTVVAILDACRDNPFASGGTRSLGGTRGLARMGASGGVFIIFSAGQKETALDKLSPTDPEQTSIFVRSFLPLIGRPDLSLIDMAKETQEKVRTLARSVGHEQTPAYYDGIVGRVSITGAVPVIASQLPPPAPSAPAAAPRNSSEDVFWQSVQDSKDPAMLKAYLAQVSAGAFPGTYRTLAEIKLASLQPPTPLVSPLLKTAPVPAKPVQPDIASTPETLACDQAAADPGDADRPAGIAGLSDDAISLPSAMAACSKAAALPNAPRRVFYEFARVAWLGKDDSRAVSNLVKAAGLRHPLAMLELGRRYRTGRGVTRDYAEARSLLQRAADADLYAAVVEIAGMYAQGQGTPRNDRLAAGFYTLALKRKEPSVYAPFGQFYADGRFVTRDMAKACELFHEGAAMGVKAAEEKARTYCR